MGHKRARTASLEDSTCITRHRPPLVRDAEWARLFQEIGFDGVYYESRNFIGGTCCALFESAKHKIDYDNAEEWGPVAECTEELIYELAEELGITLIYS